MTTYNVVEFGKQFGVEEEIGGCGELVCDGIEEDFRAVVFVLLVCALLALDGRKAELEDVDTVAEEDCFTAYNIVSFAKRESKIYGTYPWPKVQS